MIGVHADLRGQIECDRESRLALAEQITITLVGFSGGAKPGVLAHGPETAAVHRGINATRVGKFARIPEGFVRIPSRKRLFGIQAVDGKPGKRGEPRLAFWGGAGFGLAIRHAKTRSGADRRVARQADGLPRL